MASLQLETKQWKGVCFPIVAFLSVSIEELEVAAFLTILQANAVTQVGFT